MQDNFGEVGSGIWLDADIAGHIFLTQANQRPHTVPARVLLGCGYRLTHPKSGVGITLEIKNMMNKITFDNMHGHEAPLGDYIGFPLPGRTVLVTLYWKA